MDFVLINRGHFVGFKAESDQAKFWLDENDDQGYFDGSSAYWSQGVLWVPNNGEATYFIQDINQAGFTV
jgi:hypothetical protein